MAVLTVSRYGTSAGSTLRIEFSALEEVIIKGDEDLVEAACALSEAITAPQQVLDGLHDAGLDWLFAPKLRTGCNYAQEVPFISFRTGFGVNYRLLHS